MSELLRAIVFLERLAARVQLALKRVGVFLGQLTAFFFEIFFATRGGFGQVPGTTMGALLLEFFFFLLEAAGSAFGLDGEPLALHHHRVLVEPLLQLALFLQQLFLIEQKAAP